MNKATIMQLLQDGAQFNVTEGRFYHPSFKKGFRVMRVSDISFHAARNELGSALQYANGIYRII